MSYNIEVSYGSLVFNHGCDDETRQHIEDGTYSAVLAQLTAQLVQVIESGLLDEDETDAEMHVPDEFENKGDDGANA